LKAAAGSTIIAMMLAPLAALAQFAGDNPFARNNDAPAIVTDFGAGQGSALNEQFDIDFHILGSFAGTRRLDRFGSGSGVERPTPWKFYGRVGIFNFQREIEPQYNQGLRFSFRKTGPRLTGRVYIGVHRTFD
jgi:hypothetical protein